MSEPIYHDLSGDRVTLANDVAHSAWNDMLEAVMAHAATAPQCLARVLGADPGFALAHAVKGLMLLSLARAELLGPARDCLASACSAARLRPVTRREQMVIEALALWLDEAPRKAAERLEAILLVHPRDALALKLSHGIRFMLGDQREMLATLHRFAPGYDDSHPLAGYVAGCYAFALEERGFYADAERTGRRAVALSPRDAWGRHAVAHVLEMTGRAEEGIAWLADSRSIAHANNLRFHIFWHLALFRLERGDVAEVLRLYDDEIRAEATDDYRDIANAASLLARLEHAGIAVGDRWEELAAKAEGRVDDRRLVFADLHYVLSLLGAGHRDAAEGIARNLAHDALGGAGTERSEAARSGALAAQGLIAFAAGDNATAARLFGAARGGLLAIGGSHAQRDLFEQAHIEALMRAGDHELAARLLEQRLSRRGGGNRFAARRLAQLRRQAPGRLAALAIAASPIALSH